MLMVTARKQRLVLSHLSIRQLHLEPLSLQLLRNPLLSQRVSQLQSSQLVSQPATRLLLLVSRPLLPFQVRRVQPKDRKEMRNSVNMADTRKLVHKISPLCPKSPTMPSVNRHPPLRAHLRVIQTSNLSLRHNHNLGLSPPLPINSPLTTLPTPSSATPIKTTMANNMDCSKALRVNKMVQLLSNDHTVVTMVHKLRTPLNSPKVLLSRLSPDSRRLERAKPAATPLPTQPPKPSNREPLKVVHPNQVNNSSHRLETTPMVTHTTLARTMLPI